MMILFSASLDSFSPNSFGVPPGYYVVMIWAVSETQSRYRMIQRNEADNQLGFGLVLGLGLGFNCRRNNHTNL